MWRWKIGCHVGHFQRTHQDTTMQMTNNYTLYSTPMHNCAHSCMGSGTNKPNNLSRCPPKKLL
jgi:hypothetical protein